MTAGFPRRPPPPVPPDMEKNYPGHISRDGHGFLFSQSVTVVSVPVNTPPQPIGVDIPLQAEEYSLIVVPKTFSNFAFVGAISLFMEEGAGAGGRFDGLESLQTFASFTQQPAAVQPFPVPLPVLGVAFLARGKVAVKIAVQAAVVGTAEVLVQAYPGTPREYIMPLQMANNRDAELPKFCRFLYGFPTLAVTTLVFANSGLARPMLDLGGRPIPVPVAREDNLVRLGGGGDAALNNVLAICYG